MGLLSVLLFGVGLSADAASVALCEGLKLKRKNLGFACKVGLFFGIFQMLMPLLGFYVGDLMVRVPFLEPAVGWIAFGLLFFVAIKMIVEALKEKDEAQSEKAALATTRELFLLAVATSIDALTVGITFAAEPPALFAGALADINVLFSSALIGCVTFSISLFAVLAGRAAGKWLGNRAEVVGGVILLLLSVKILLSNFGIALDF